MSTPTLPHLSDERVAGIERTVFARIAADRSRSRRRRRIGWTGAGAAAAVVVAAAVIGPSLTSAIGGGADGGASDYAVAPATDGGVSLLPGEARTQDLEGAMDEGAATSSAAREVIANGSATVVVADVEEAARAVTADAEARGGYVESLTVGGSGDVRAGTDGGTIVGPVPSPADGWVSVRIPAEALDAAMAALREVGEVTSATVSRDDVTVQAIDLRARVASAEASVARLTELLAQASSVSDLVAAEDALAQRQAALESDRQQLEWLEGQVAMSTLTVQLELEHETVTADPAGFADGVAAGWNGLVATLNGIVVALGFLLPWLAVLGVAALAVWGGMRLARRRRRPRRSAPAGDGVRGQAT